MSTYKQSKNRSYLLSTPSGYSFRIKVPIDLVAVLKKKEIRIALPAPKLTVAKCMSMSLASCMLLTFQSIRAKHMALTPQEIYEFVRDHAREELRKWEDARLTSRKMTVTEVKKESEELEQERSRRRKQIIHNDLDNVRSIADQILRGNQITGIDETDYLRLKRELLVAELKIVEAKLNRVAGEYPSLGLNHPQTLEYFENGTKKEKYKLSFVVERYLEEKRKIVERKTLDEYEKCLALLISVIGDVYIGDVDRKLISDYKSKLLRLPSNMKKKAQYRNKTISELLLIEITDDDLFNLESVKKYLTRASELFKFAVMNGYTDSNPAEGMAVTKVAKRDFEKRDAYSIDELRILFFSSEYMEDKFTEPFQFWVPIIALYTGCRLEEICQLYLDDIKRINDIWVFDINEEGEKRLKNTTAKRIVPIHPLLIEGFGLLEYVEKLRKSGFNRLFPELLRQRDGYSPRVSKWFARYRKRCGIVVPKGKRKDFHSLRHVFIDCCKQNQMDTVLLSELVGHANQSETTGRYGKRYKAEVLYTEIVSRVVYDSLDLLLLKKSKFVRPAQIAKHDIPPQDVKLQLIDLLKESLQSG